MKPMQLSRRLLLAAGGAALSFPALSWAQAGGAKKLVLVVLRGGLDGLAALAPIGDPDYTRVRGRLAQADALALNGMFALHPRLPKFNALYQAGELLPVHACATPYRERSHFDAQNVLESGAAQPFGRDSGWLNAALGTLSTSAGRERGLALSAQAPLVLRGPNAVATWSPSALPAPASDTIARVMDLYERSDPALATALHGAIAANSLVDGADGAGARGPRAVSALARVAATFLRQTDGPTAAVVEMSGWDTHANQGLEQGPLARNLGALDDGLDTLKTELGPAWRDTLVVIITEFGRTAAPNGAGGTDHGTAAAAFLAGGVVAGGRVLSDWPGLSAGALLERRDLRPTTDLRAVLKGALADHLRVSSAALGRDVFPDSAALAPIQGLLRA
ncbi:MAG: DUF1501 domain-containing protein [Phycisphaerales bacterium]|nr:DUF1501 domain-containing protein [Hyphomonadaceae bacterium]